MNAAQLLDPRGYAKQKGKKKAPNYGPKQSRKPTALDSEAKTAVTSYDPKSLLDPKSASKQTTSSTSASMKSSSNVAETSNGAMDTPPDAPKDKSDNVLSLYERHHAVTNRQAPVATKRKAPEDFDTEDAENKKQKSSFGNAGRGGILSEHLRKERERLNADHIQAVDLTEDKDDEDDIEFLGSNNLSKEVCLGMISVQVNAHAVPHVSVGVAARLGNNHWPQTRVHLVRPSPDQRQIIEVQDSTRKTFGKIDYNAATALSWLMDGSQYTKFRMKAFLKMRAREPGESAGQPISRKLDMTLTCYAMRMRADKIGSWLKSKQLMLENPPVIDNGIELYNPHKRTVNGLPDYRPSETVKRPSARTNYAHELGYVTRTVEEMRREASSMFDSLVKTEDLPEMEADSTRIATQLKPHQKQALHFLVEHEKHDFIASDKPGFSLWKLQPDKNEQVWYNVITLEKSSTKPHVTRGGILADMMGLGKSLSILSLVAATIADSKTFGPTAVPDEIKIQDGINSRATLIVCPTSVLAGWIEQIQTHAQEGKLTCAVYHGTGRTRDLAQLAKCHIVLTSYGTLVSDYNGSTAHKRTLMRINWFRVVLDEAHTIRNPSTTASKACCELTAERRWAVTGTPVQNRLEDLGALIKFLRVKPFDDSQKWAQHITAPFKSGNSDAFQHLRLLVDSITLRRVRDAIQLPNRSERIVRLDFTPEEEVLYSAFSSRSNLKLQTLVDETKGLRGKSMIHVLHSLQRLRMLCAHGREMLTDEDMEEIQGFDESYAIDLGDEPDLVRTPHFVSEKQAYDILQMQYDGNIALCSQCSKSLPDLNAIINSEDDAETDESDSESATDTQASTKNAASRHLMGYLTPCLHLLHPACKEVHKTTNSVGADGYHECPCCASYVRSEYFPLTRSGFKNFVAEKIKRSRLTRKANIDPETYVPHTKVKALIEELQRSAEETANLPDGEPPIRSVVFSGWTTYLDLIEYGLDSVGISHIRLDGTMSLRTRTEVLKRFREDREATVLLISIRAGGQGLNLTAANKVYLMEPQFNPGVEQQAVDRVHRLGQERDVEITHYIMAGSVENGLLMLQEKKTKLAQLSLDRKKTRDEDVKQKIAELKSLFK